MATLNSISIIGNLGKDPEIRFTPTGKKVAKFSVAVNERWTDANGSEKERTDWIQCEAWNGLADIVKQYLGKGRQVYVHGKLRIDEVEKNGAKSWYTKVQVRDIQFLGVRPQSDVGNVAEPDFETEEEIPFG